MGIEPPDLLHGRPEYVPLPHQPYGIETYGIERQNSRFQPTLGLWRKLRGMGDTFLPVPFLPVILAVSQGTSRPQNQGNNASY